MSSKTSSNGKDSPHYELYNYIPSLPAATIAIIIFAILTIAHCYRLIKRRTWFCIAFAFGGLFETVGYVGRALGHSDKKAMSPYIVQSILILVAPALFAATIYMTLGRLMRSTHATSYSIIRVTWMTKIFVVGDVLSFFIQGGGGGIMASGNGTNLKMGENIILGGLFLQIIMFGVFILASVIFHIRMLKQPTQQSYNPELRWERVLFVLYAVSALIMTRNIFRVADYIGGHDGVLLRVEWPVYVFDMLLMASTMAIFFWGYPENIQPKIIDSDASVEMPPAQSVDVSGRAKDQRQSHAGSGRR